MGCEIGRESSLLEAWRSAWGTRRWQASDLRYMNLLGSDFRDLPLALGNILHSIMGGHLSRKVT